MQTRRCFVLQLCSPKTCTNAGFSLKLLYQKYLLDYERVFEWGQPDISPAPAPRGGMPIPDYLPENVALPDPYMGRGRPDYGDDMAQAAAAAAAVSSGGSSTRKRLRSDADEEDNGGGGGLGPTAVSASSLLMLEAVAEDEDEEELPEVAKRDLAAALKRVELSLASKKNREVDWALSVLMIQTRKKLPVFFKDPSRRLLDDLVLLLHDCKDAHALDPLMGHYFNPLAFEGAVRRARIAVILVNAVAVDENLKIMASNSGLLSALVDYLASVPPRAEKDLETRLNVFVVLDALIAKGVKLQSGSDTAPALARVLSEEIACRDLRQPVCLAAIAKLSRDRDNLAMLSPALTLEAMHNIVRVLGEAMAQQSVVPGGEAGLLELETSLDAITNLTGDPAAVELLSRTNATHLLVMFLRAAADASSPRHYLALFRRTVNALLNLVSASPAAREMVQSRYLSDLLHVGTCQSPVAADVLPLLEQIRP